MLFRQDLLLNPENFRIGTYLILSTPIPPKKIEKTHQKSFRFTSKNCEKVSDQ